MALKIVLMGTGDFAVPPFRALLSWLSQNRLRYFSRTVSTDPKSWNLFVHCRPMSL
jgi:hypothetical protein